MSTVIREKMNRVFKSRHKFAKAASLSQSQISQLVQGKLKTGLLLQTRISKALGVDPSEIFDEDGWPKEAA